MSGQGNDITISELGDYPFSSSSTARISRTIAAHRGRGELFGAAFHFIVEPLERIRAVQFAAVLLGDVEIIAATLPRCRRVRLEGAALPIRDRDRLAC
jgi:hypothetical protein